MMTLELQMFNTSLTKSKYSLGATEHVLPIYSYYYGVF